MIKTLSLSVCLVLLCAQSALAQPICGDRAQIAKKLLTHFGEHRTALGQALDGRIVEIFSSERGMTWTVVVSRPGRPGCIVATGKGQQISLADAARNS